MAFASHIITVRRLKKYIDDVIGKKANLPNNKKTIIDNLGTTNTNVTNLTSQLGTTNTNVTNLTTQTNNLSTQLSSVSNKVSNLESTVDSALIYRGKIKNNNVVYGAYDSGIYVILGSEAGIPLQGYGGFMTVYRNSATSLIIKHIILQNAYQFVMAQKAADGTVTLSWVRTYPAG